jgi:hypothetical protein
VKLEGRVPRQLLDQISGETAWLISGPLRENAPPQMQAPPEFVIQVVPGSQVLEQYVVPNIGVCTRVRLRPPESMSVNLP